MEVLPTGDLDRKEIAGVRVDRETIEKMQILRGVR